MMNKEKFFAILVAWLAGVGIFLGMGLVRPADAAVSVSFRPDGTWIVDDQPFFPHGTFFTPGPHQEDSTWIKMKEAKINTTVASFAPEKSKKYGIKQIAWWVGGSPHTTLNKEVVREYIDKYDSTIIGWYGADEADQYLEESLPDLRKWYKDKQEIDPYRPVTTAFWGLGSRLHPAEWYADYLKSYVLASHDRSRKWGHTTFAYYSGLLTDLRQQGKIKSGYVIIQAWEKEKDFPKLPYDAYQSIISGINAVFFWDYPYGQGGGYQGSFWEMVKKINQELDILTPALLSQQKQFVSSGPIHYLKAKGTDGRWYIIMVSYGGDPQGYASYTITGLPSNTDFEELFYGSGIVKSTSRGELSGTLRVVLGDRYECRTGECRDYEGGGIRIYRQKGTPLPTPTLTPAPILGDLDGDRDVDNADFEIFKGDFGKTGAAGFIPADIDKNGKVDIFDYNVLVGNFGK